MQVVKYWKYYFIWGYVRQKKKKKVLIDSFFLPISLNQFLLAYSFFIFYFFTYFRSKHLFNNKLLEWIIEDQYTKG